MTQKSALFTAYNKARRAARSGKLDIGRVNRALGVAQAKRARPYQTTVKGCDCPDGRRGNVCKHRIAAMLQVRAAQYRGAAA